MNKVIVLTLFSLMLLFSCNNIKPDVATTRHTKNKSFKIPWNKFYKKNIKLKDLEINKLENTELGIEIDNNDRYSWFKADSIDPYLSNIRKYSKSKETYYYAILDTARYYSLIYYSYGDYEGSYDLVNYTKQGDFMDSQLITSFGGDGGYFYKSESKFVNDSIIIRTDQEGEYIDYDSITGISKEKILFAKNIQLTLQRDGKIKVDTIR